MERMKRNQERLFKVQNGAAEMEVWLKDLVNSGLLTLQQKDADYFENMRSKMVDAQAPGLGNLIRELKEFQIQKNNSWQEESVHTISKMFLLLEGIKQLESLDSKSQNDIKYLVGWNVNQKEVLENPEAEVLSDNWLQIFRITEMIEDITVQRNWFYGLQSGRFALIINFAFRNATIETKLVPASTFAMELVFVPSNMPLRAFVRNMNIEIPYSPEGIVMHTNFEEILEKMSLHRSAYPWLEDHPFAISQVRPVVTDNKYFLIDLQNEALALPDDFDRTKCLHLLACTGSLAHDMFILIQKEKAIPMGIIGRKRYVLVN